MRPVAIGRVLVICGVICTALSCTQSPSSGRQAQESNTQEILIPEMPGQDQSGQRRPRFVLKERLAAYGLSESRYVAGKAAAISGRAILIDNKVIHLWGVDAPEFEQWPEGPWARAALGADLGAADIECVEVGEGPDGKPVSICTNPGGFIPRAALLPQLATLQDYDPTDLSLIEQDAIRQYLSVLALSDQFELYLELNKPDDLPGEVSREQLQYWKCRDECGSAALINLRESFEDSDLENTDFVRGQATAVDGSTLQIDGRTVRLWGVIAPGLDQSPWGQLSQATLADEVGDAPVECGKVGEAPNGDMIAICENADGHLPANVLNGGLAVVDSEAMARMLNHDIRGPESMFVAFLIYEAFARSSRHGLWRDEPRLTPPKER